MKQQVKLLPNSLECLIELHAILECNQKANKKLTERIIEIVIGGDITLKMELE